MLSKREYLKWHIEAKDMLGKDLKPGDTVVINNNYHRTPNIGVLSHFTESGNCAVKIIYSIKSKEYYWMAYREPCTVVKLKSERKKK